SLAASCRRTAGEFGWKASRAQAASFISRSRWHRRTARLRLLDLRCPAQLGQCCAVSFGRDALRRLAAATRVKFYSEHSLPISWLARPDPPMYGLHPSRKSWIPRALARWLVFAAFRCRSAFLRIVNDEDAQANKERDAQAN